MAGTNTKGLSRTLVESYVRKQIRGLKSSPEKGIAKLSDLAENITNEQIKQQILKILQEMLADKKGGSYRLFCHLLSTVNSEHLVTLGMNIGYNSLYAAGTAGISSLKIDGLHYESNATRYKKHLADEKKSGIHTWLLFMQKNIWKLIPTIQKEKDCAFLIFCPASCLTEKFLNTAKSLKNLMLCIDYSSVSPKTFDELNKRKLPYSVFVNCDSKTVSEITQDAFLCKISKNYPVFTFFITKELSGLLHSDVQGFVKNNRTPLKYPTIPVELTI